MTGLARILAAGAAALAITAAMTGAATAQENLGSAVSFPGGWFSGEGVGGAPIAFDFDAEAFPSHPQWVMFRIPAALPPSGLSASAIHCFARPYDDGRDVVFDVKIAADGPGSVISGRAGSDKPDAWRPVKYTLNCQSADATFASQTFAVPPPPRRR